MQHKVMVMRNAVKAKRCIEQEILDENDDWIFHKGHRWQTYRTHFMAL